LALRSLFWLACGLCSFVDGTRSHRCDYLCKIREFDMASWHDTMVDRSEENEAYAAGWTISGLAVVGTILAVWLFAI
jgi:hypothetical protein